MAFLTLVQPAQEPVSLANMKQFLRLDSGFTADDALISALITAAREQAEAFCERAWIFQTKRLLMDFFPGYIDFKLAGQRVSSPFVSGSNAILVGIRYAIALPWPQARQIVVFEYQDQSGNVQSMTAGTDYIQDLDSQPARLTPLFGAMWPVARVVANAVQLDYITGYQGTLSVGMTASSAVLAATLNGANFSFLPRDVGAAITVPGAGAAGVALATTIASVDSSGVATLAAAAGTTVSAQSTTFGTMPQSVLAAIMLLCSYYYEHRDAALIDGEIPFGIKALLYPYRDLRL